MSRRHSSPDSSRESERDNVELLVVPFSVRGFPTAGDFVLYAAASSPHLDTVQVDSPIGAVFFDSPNATGQLPPTVDAVIEALAQLDTENAGVCALCAFHYPFG